MLRQSDLRHIRFEGARALKSRALRPVSGRRFVRGSGVTTPQPAPSAGSLGYAVLSRAGLDPRSYREPPVQRRISACLRALQVADEPAAKFAIAADDRASTLAIDSLLLGVSSFFRDADVFDMLERRIVPDLAATGRRIRVLSIGCSTGAELYSVGMLLEEAGALERTRLVGIDCRHSAIESARRAVFTSADLATVPEHWRSRAFTYGPRGAQVVPRLRDRAEWLVADATAGLPAGPFDLVLCRNLLIYLRTPAIRRLLDAVAGVIAPHGVLVLGKAEQPGTAMPITQLGRCIYRHHD